jgi:hypothetical protein
VAILATLMALPITSAGRRWPLGPRGIYLYRPQTSSVRMQTGLPTPDGG